MPSFEVVNDRIVILGAGPTGLGAAHRLGELEHADWDIYERYPYVGGLAASVTDESGFVWDHGGHVMFSHYRYFDDLVETMLDGDYDEHMREAWVWIHGRHVPFPLQSNLHRLPIGVFLDSFRDILTAQSQAPKRGNFDQYLRTGFGEELSRQFMLPYNQKVWAHPLEEMSTAWLGERVANVDLGRLVDHAVADQDDVSWGPNNRFKFPLLGTGMLYERIAASLARPVRLGRTVTHIDPSERRVTFDSDETTSYDRLITTLPLPDLLACFEEIPNEVSEALRSLSHTSGHFIGVGVDEPTSSSKCWIYYPDPELPFYRVTYLSNYSPKMTPKPGQFSLLAEVSSSAHRPQDAGTLVDRTVSGLVEAQLLTERQAESKIVSRHKISVEYSYPVPTIGRDAALETIQAYLMERDVYSRGRFGAWKYEIGNTDHSVMMGVEAVGNILEGTPETTWSL